MNEWLKVGVIGVGNMGGAMADRLRALGHAVIVRDIRPEAEAALVPLGVRVAASPAEVAAQADFVVIAVVDAVQNEAVCFGEPQALVTAFQTPFFLPHGALNTAEPGRNTAPEALESVFGCSSGSVRRSQPSRKSSFRAPSRGYPLPPSRIHRS